MLVENVAIAVTILGLYFMVIGLCVVAVIVFMEIGELVSKLDFKAVIMGMLIALTLSAVIFVSLDQAPNEVSQCSEGE